MRIGVAPAMARGSTTIRPDVSPPPARRPPAHTPVGSASLARAGSLPTSARPAAVAGVRVRPPSADTFPRSVEPERAVESEYRHRYGSDPPAPPPAPTRRGS